MGPLTLKWDLATQVQILIGLGLVWVSLFNGISTFLGYLMQKSFS